MQDPSEGKHKIVIDKCWNIVRAAIEQSVYMNKYSVQIEDMLKPLYVMISEPAKITFEDELVMAVKSQIRKTKKVTDTQWDILGQFPKV